jgi:hypothetical protein
MKVSLQITIDLQLLSGTVEGFAGGNEMLASQILAKTFHSRGVAVPARVPSSDRMQLCAHVLINSSCVPACLRALRGRRKDPRADTLGAVACLLYQNRAYISQKAALRLLSELPACLPACLPASASE